MTDLSTPTPFTMARPIFIGGLMKSGTTLLRALVANHPQIFGGLETHWFGDEFRKHWRDADAPSVSRLLNFFEVAPSAYADLLDGCADPFVLLGRFMAHCAHRSGASRWVEKTPGNVVHTDLIEQHWPDALFIHVIRDLRDVYASWKKNQKYDLDRFVSDVHAITDHLGPRLGNPAGAYHEVRYRDLVLEPRATMEEVITFIGEPWVDGIEINRKGREEHDRVKATTGKSSPTLDSLAKPIFTHSLGQYETILSSEECSRIENELSDYIAKTKCFPNG